jgi:primosomal protein N' (replication factor Y)
VTVAKVVILREYADLDQPLDYNIPPEVSAPVGSFVQVSLGNRRVRGIVFAHAQESEFKSLKDLEVLSGSLSLELVELAKWLAVRAGCSVPAVLSALLPPAGGSSTLVRWRVNEVVVATDLTEKQQLVVDFLRQRQPMLKAEICRALGVSLTPINSLVQKEILIPADPFLDSPWDLRDVEELTAEQDGVLVKIAEETGNYSRAQEFLLHGVTGSGKTEIYIRLAQGVLDQGRQALILVPEIALTAQLVARFKRAFGAKIAVLHSGLSANQRAADWEKIARGEYSIVIGTRSAVFAPLERIGLIVLDEEHEPAYKQEETPRYHARDVAVFRARWHKALLVLGSATPALESFARAEAGRYRLLQLPQRVHKHAPVITKIVDMRRELAQGNRDMLSRELRSALEETLARKEQALLFLNRRGVAPTVLCRNCGFRYSCPNCSTALTLHRGGRLICHHCGVSASLVQRCPQCDSKYLRELGLGTQKLEARLSALFPGAAVCRLDRDTAASAQDKEEHLSRFYQQESGILLGTQMIAKGLDFPQVTLVGIVLADLSLGMPDFRAAERTFQLVTQAAGRTGRADKPGRVLIQTYQPEHYSLQFAKKGDYRGFYRFEMDLRRGAGMPPFSALTRILVSSPEQDALLAQVEEVSASLATLGLEILYSGPPPLERLKGRYRWHYILRHSGGAAAWRAIDQMRRMLKVGRHCRVIVDNNPINFM